MKNGDSEFVFVGYQLREVPEVNILGTLADNIHPLYLPRIELLRAEFDSLITKCSAPFFVTTESDLLHVVEISKQDSEMAVRVLTFRCAILRADMQSACFEYYDDSRTLVQGTFDYANGMSEPRIGFEALGYDVLDITLGGGSDSAIHTYKLSSQKLNEHGLLDSLDEAIALRTHAANEFSDHARFTIWSVGLVSMISGVRSGNGSAKESCCFSS